MQRKRLSTTKIVIYSLILSSALVFTYIILWINQQTIYTSIEYTVLGEIISIEPAKQDNKEYSFLGIPGTQFTQKVTIKSDSQGIHTIYVSDKTDFDGQIAAKKFKIKDIRYGDKINVQVQTANCFKHALERSPNGCYTPHAFSISRE